MAGHKAVIITDVIQSGIILLLLFIITLGIVGSEGVSQALRVGNNNIDIFTMISFFLFGLLSFFPYTHIYQLCFAAKNKNTVRNGFAITIIPILLTASLLFLIGNYMYLQNPGMDPGLAFTEALKNYLPKALLPVGVVLFFAGIMSSADSNIYGISSSLALNKNKGTIKSIKTLMLLLAIISTIISLVLRNVVDISILAGGLTLSLSLPMVYIIASGKSKNKFIASSYGGLIGFFLGVVIFGISANVAIPTLVVSALGLLWPKTS